MSLIETGAMILPGPIVGAGWDTIVRDCERALQVVKPGTHWIRRDDPMRHDEIAAAVNARTVSQVERYTLSAWHGRIAEISLVCVTLNARGRGRKSEIRADRFLRDYIEVRP